MLEVKDLCAYYGESIILKNVNLQVPDGRVVCLIGRNGVGKTTLLKSIMSTAASTGWGAAPVAEIIDCTGPPPNKEEAISAMLLTMVS